jgi:predicted MFS family arabinose efflux permease
MDLAKKINIGTIAASHGVNSFYIIFLIPILPVIAKDFELNYVEVGLIASVYAFANGVFQLPISFLGDYMGRWRSVLAVSFLVQAGGVFLYGLAPTYPIFLAFVFLSGLGCSAYHPPAIAIITRESPAQRGFMMGIFVGGGDVGSIITPTLVGWLTVYLSSWRLAAHWSLIAGIVMALIIWWRFEDVQRDKRPIKQAARATLRAFLDNTPLLLLVLLSTFRITGFRGLMTFLPLLLAQSFGFDTHGIGWTMSAFFVIGMVMTVIIGKLSDSGSKTKYIIVLTLMCGLSLVTLSWADTVPGVLAAIAAVGFFLAPVPSLVLAVGTELVEERHRASAVGLVYACNEGASTLSPLIGGLVAEAFGLRFSFLFYALLFLAATAIALILHRVGGRLKTAEERGA